MKSDIGYIIKYIFEYDSCVPISVVFEVCVVVVGGIALLYPTKTSNHDFIRNASWCLLSGYVFLVLCATVLFRHDTGEIHYSFRPLWSYTTLYFKYGAGAILNILMFIPIGFLVGVSLRRSNVIMILGIGFLLSMTIELAQLFSRRGVCNIDDVIHNTLGCVLGYGIAMLCKMIGQKFYTIRK